MKPEFAGRLRCPTCRHDGTLRLHAQDSDGRETRSGVLRCIHCAAEQPVRRGVAELLVDPPEHVSREAAGLERFAEKMRANGWTRDMILSLPDVEHGYWYAQRVSIDQVMRGISPRPGEWLLDLGSNTCWASNRFALHGLNVIALDIALWELQGLWTADFFIEDGVSYFERVLGSMSEIPLASGSLDYVFACEVLHHNDSAGLRLTFEEAHRVLRPGGRMLIVNETLKTLRDTQGVHTDDVAEFEGYEHAHWAVRYHGEAIRAGFSTASLEPAHHQFFAGAPPLTRPPLRPIVNRVRDEARRHAATRRAYLSLLHHVRGGTSFGMIATKPTRPRARAIRRLVRGSRRPSAPSG